MVIKRGGFERGIVMSLNLRTSWRKSRVFVQSMFSNVVNTRWGTLEREVWVSRTASSKEQGPASRNKGVRRVAK